MANVPETSAFTGHDQPARFKADAADLEVEGEVPPHLDRAFYRVQPDPQFPLRTADDIAPKGGSMVTPFRPKAGKIEEVAA